MKTLAGPQSGARGDEVASRNRSGQFLRKRVSPKNPRTAAQRRVRKYMRTSRACGTRSRSGSESPGARVPAKSSAGPSWGNPARWMGRSSLTRSTPSWRSVAGSRSLNRRPAREFGPNPVVALTATNGPGGIALMLSLSETLQRTSCCSPRRRATPADRLAATSASLAFCPLRMKE